MGKVRVDGVSISLDGFAAGPNQSEANPLGENGRKLHEWMVRTAAWRAAHGLEGGTVGVDNEMVSNETVTIGATIMGRNTYGPIRGPWPNLEWTGWWGAEPPFKRPVFVLTHFERPSLTLGATTFEFVTGGIRDALTRAKAVAGDGDISLMGANTINQFLCEGLIDEMHLIVVPVLLGGGSRLFADPGYPVGWLPEQVVSSGEVAHVRLSREEM